jgi:hypothetical protein
MEMIVAAVVSDYGARSWNKLAELKVQDKNITDPLLNFTDEIRGGKTRDFIYGVHFYVLQRLGGMRWRYVAARV